MKISEFLLVRTNFKIFPGWKAAPCRVQMDPVQIGAGGANRSTPSLHTMQKRIPLPLRQIGKTFSSIGDYSSIFSHLMIGSL